MLQIGEGFVPPGNGVALRHGATAQPMQLREYVPHPVRPFSPGAQLLQRLFVVVALGIDKALQVEWVVHGQGIPS